MEDLQKALRKVGGLETFGSSNNFTLEETSVLGELADTRNKESTVTTIGGTGAMTGGQEKMNLEEVNGFQGNSSMIFAVLLLFYFILFGSQHSAPLMQELKCCIAETCYDAPFV